jgi:hypothetical protein
MGANRRRGAIATVSEYSHLPPLQCARHDEEEIVAALRATGFEVEPAHIIREPKETPNLYNWLNAVFGQAPPESIFVLYFSGHGTRIERGRYVFCLREFPQDEGKHAFSQTHASVVDDDLELFISTSKVRPRLVLVVFDACNRVNEVIKDLYIESRMVTRAKPVSAPADVTFAFAADIGYIAGFEVDGCSFYTKAFAEAIGPNHPARTAREVLTEVDKILAELHPEQKADWTHPKNKALMDVPIFDSPAGPAGPSADPTLGPTPQSPSFPYLEIETEDGTWRLGFESSKIHEMSEAERDEIQRQAREEILSETRRKASRSQRLPDEGRRS